MRLARLEFQYLYLPKGSIRAENVTMHSGSILTGGWTTLPLRNTSRISVRRLSSPKSEPRRIIPHHISQKANANNGGCRILCRSCKESEEHRCGHARRQIN